MFVQFLQKLLDKENAIFFQIFTLGFWFGKLESHLANE